MIDNEGFCVEYGDGITTDLFASLKDTLVITLPEIWDSVSSYFECKPEKIYFLDTLEIKTLERLAERYKHVGSICGMGGGRAADIAKFIHWKNGTVLYQIPTIISVDAFFTHEIAVRDNGIVKYVGDAVPELIYVDFSIIKKAPAELNRSGIGDILSCHTGLYDWKLAHIAGEKPEWNESLAFQTRKTLDHVLGLTKEIRGLSNEGMKLMVEALNWIGNQCYVQKHARFEEGSEHHFVYNLEYVTGKHFVHGQAVCLGCYIMSVFQENEPEKVLRAIQESGVDIRPESLDVTWKDVEETLFTLREFVRNKNLPYTILYEKEVTSELFEKVKNFLT